MTPFRRGKQTSFVGPVLSGLLLFLPSLLQARPLSQMSQPISQEEKVESIAEQPTHGGPLVVERVPRSFVLSPDFRVTELDDDSVGLAGAYGGWLVDKTLLVGFGAYFNTNRSEDQKFGYGGLVVEWFAPQNGFLTFSLRGLVGGGSATLGDEVTISRPGGDFRFARRQRNPFGQNRLFRGGFEPETGNVFRIIRSEGFFVAEPQANLFLRFSRHVRLGLGMSYRFIQGDRDFESRLRGPAASVSLQFGSF